MMQQSQQSLAAGSTWQRSHKLLTVGLILTIVVTAFEAMAIATALPTVVRDIGGLQFYGWAFSAFMLGNVVGLTTAGDEADRCGPVRPFLVGVVLFVLGLLIAGLAPTMIVVIAGRTIQGLGTGALNSVAYATVGRAYTEAARPRMFALFSSTWVLPSLVGPLVAGLVADHIGWRWVFFGLVPFAPIAALLTLARLRNLEHASTAPPNWKRTGQALLLALGAGVVLGGVETPLLLAVVLVPIGGFVAVWAFRTLVPAGTLRAAPGLPATIAALGLLNVVFFGSQAFVPLAFTEVRGFSSSMAGVVLTVASLFWTVGAWAQERFVKHRKHRLAAFGGLALVGLGIAGGTLVLTLWVPYVAAIVAWCVAGLGMGLAFTTMTVLVLAYAPSGHEDMATAAMNVTNGLGAALGTGVGGAIVGVAGTTRGIATQNGLMVAVIIAGLVAATRLYQHTRELVAPTELASAASFSD